MNFYDKNVSFLDENDVDALSKCPEGDDLLVTTTRSGDLTLKYKGVYLHSAYDPVIEARRWAEESAQLLSGKSCAVVFGFGLGYLVEELVKRFDGDVIVYEGNLSALRAALQARDLSGVLRRIKLKFDPTVPDIYGDFALLSHLPSVKTMPDFYGEVERKLKVWKEVCLGVRILLVGPIQGGSYPITLFVKDALEEMGHEVFFLDFSALSDGYTSLVDAVSDGGRRSRLRNMLAAFGGEVVVEKALEWQPDLVFALAQAPLLPPNLERLAEAGIPTAFWFVENYRHLGYWKEVAPYYDYFFTIQKGEFHEALDALGVENYAYFPLACNPSFHRPLQLSQEEIEEFGSDVSFVGAGYYNRHVMFQGLLDFDFKIWGDEWNLASPLGRCVQRNGARISPEEMVKIFNATKVNLNLHSSSQHAGVDPMGDFVNPRTFEIAACGAFQLVDEREVLDELFDDGDEIVTFRSLEDLRDKISYFLERDEERREIAERGRRRALAEHTYVRRLERMFRFMVDRGYVPPMRGLRGKDRRALLEECADHPELVPLISGAGNRRRVSIDELAEVIRDGKGRLTSVERILLLLKEVKDQMVGAPR